MRDSRSALVLTILIAAIAADAEAQSLNKRHQIEFRMGLWNQVADTRTAVGSGGVSTSVGASGFVGGIAYGHWLQEQLALRISIGGMAASVATEVGAVGVSTEFAIVAPILFGLKYYFPKSTYGSAARPYVTGNAGAFVGSQARTDTGAVVTVEERNEAAIGGEAGAGIDFLLGRDFLLSVQLAYDIMADFAQPIGGSDNYSGPQLTLGFSYVFGRGAAN
jgi:hypothetical protein